MNRWSLFLSIVLALPGVAAHAHDDAWFDTRPSAHGGQTRMAGPIHIELVRGADALELYVTDHANQPQATAGGTAALRFPAQGLRLDLSPGGDNRFRAAWPAAMPRDAEVVAFVQLAGQQAQSARFVPAAAPAPDSGSGNHADHARHPDDHAH